MPKFVHDQRTGAGYGFVGRKGFQTQQKAGNIFPYQQDDDIIEDELSDEDMNLKARINKKLSYGNLGRQPEPSNRVDRFTLAKNRLDLAESDDSNNTRILIGLVPFPMRKFDGPAIGGASVNPSYTVAPGRIDGSPYGWTKGELSPLLPAEDAPPRFLDVIDPEVRERSRKKLKIARLK